MPIIRQFNAEVATGVAATTIVTQNIGEPVYRIHDDHPPFPPYASVEPIAPLLVQVSIVGNFEPYYLIEDASPGLVWNTFIPHFGNVSLILPAHRQFFETIQAVPVGSVAKITETPRTYIPQVHSLITVQPIIIRAPVTTTDNIG